MEILCFILLFLTVQKVPGVMIMKEQNISVVVLLHIFRARIRLFTGYIESLAVRNMVVVLHSIMLIL